jgi:serine O-acetyltransferase
MNRVYRKQLYEAFTSASKCVSISTVGDWFDCLLSILFPVSIELEFENEAAFNEYMEDLEARLVAILDCSVKDEDLYPTKICNALFEELPILQKKLDADIDAIYLGDPAAKSRAEVMRCYPGVYAIAAYRIAHFLFQLGVPMIPRMITESAHSRTGIDIHPGAKIGSHFFIDHGTGVVIGATAIIGSHVKIYQGVTLGGLSVNKEEADIKRHPTIEDHVVIYSGATILGGDTVIGEHSTIGGNTFLTKSVSANTVVYHTPTNREKQQGWN